MFESRLLSKLAAAASVVGHVAIVVAVLLYTGVRPFESEGASAITVDLVEPDEIKPPEPAVKPPEPEPTLPDLKPTAETPQPSEPQPPPQQAAPEQPANAPQDPPQDPPQAAQPQPPAAAPAFTPPPPDLTVKYGVMLGLPESPGNSDFDNTATDRARLAASDIAAFRRHLRSCSTMPDAIDAGDDVWVKLRASFTTDGRLIAPPLLIEGKASPKALALAHAAIAALQACQPYAMLPSARYDEWKVLDLTFSPADFSRN